MLTETPSMPRLLLATLIIGALAVVCWPWQWVRRSPKRIDGSPS
jgi:hypothetical protein